jgi:hypothetical protein
MTPPVRKGANSANGCGGGADHRFRADYLNREERENEDVLTAGGFSAICV